MRITPEYFSFVYSIVAFQFLNVVNAISLSRDLLSFHAAVLHCKLKILAGHYLNQMFSVVFGIDSSGIIICGIRRLFVVCVP